MHKSKGLLHDHTYSLYSAVETPRWGPASLTDGGTPGDDLPLERNDLCSEESYLLVSPSPPQPVTRALLQFSSRTITRSTSRDRVQKLHILVGQVCQPYVRSDFASFQ
jgi:hypothetical protein